MKRKMLELSERFAPTLLARVGAFISVNHPDKLVHHILRHVRDTNEEDRDDILQFLAYAIAHAKNSRSQLFQDLWACWEAGRKRDGYFVEFGAGDGVFLSNTYLLETMGWSGILAEPHPESYRKLTQSRRCLVFEMCVYSRTGENIDFIVSDDPEYSRINGIVPNDDHEMRRKGILKSVETISLDDLLIKAGAPETIDFMSIDTEGSEYDILGAFDFERWNVKCLCVEQNTPRAQKMIGRLLAAHGYRRKWPAFSMFDGFYTKIER